MKRKQRIILFGMVVVALIFAACDGDSSTGGGVGGGSYGTLSDNRDGQTYNTVRIGTQTWMAENLNYAVDSSWCYENRADNCAKYGRLYRWVAVMGVASTYDSAILGDSVNHQGICPSGWHVPRSSEWATLEKYVGSSMAGTALKSTGGWDEGGNGTDAYGFSVLPAGNRDDSGYFDGVGSYAIFWSAMEIDTFYAYYWLFLSTFEYMYTDDYIKHYAFSVRCLKD